MNRNECSPWVTGFLEVTMSDSTSGMKLELCIMAALHRGFVRCSPEASGASRRSHRRISDLSVLFILSSLLVSQRLCIS